jgi:hypothetical protein
VLDHDRFLAGRIIHVPITICHPGHETSEEKTRKAIDLALGAAVDGLPSSVVPGLYREGA